MSILLLIVAVICWAVAAVPGFIQIALDRVSWGWLGLFFFRVWLLVGGAERLLAFARQPR